jgi:hypothetical protein
MISDLIPWLHIAEVGKGEKREDSRLLLTGTKYLMTDRSILGPSTSSGSPARFRRRRIERPWTDHLQRTCLAYFRISSFNADQKLKDQAAMQ